MSKPSAAPASMPPVDLVLVFKIDPKKSKKKDKLTPEQRAAVSTQFSNLISRIEQVGLHHTSRVVDGGNTILIFVHAPQSTLLAAKKLHSLSDFLHGVKPTFDHHIVVPRRSSLASAAKTSTHVEVDITPADRLRIVYDLLTLPISTPKPSEEAGSSAEGTGTALATAAGSALPAHTITGAGISPNMEPFPNLVDITPIHDDNFNHDWMKLCQTTTLNLTTDQIDKVRAHFGEDLALYFAWLGHYAAGLTPLAIVGGLYWYFAAPYSPMYSLFLVSWAAILVETWRMREKRLAVRWGVIGCNRADNRRTGFKPRIVRTHPVTGEIEEVFEWWRRELRIAFVSLPSLVMGAAVVGLTITSMFVSEVFVSKLYQGPGSAIVPYLPTIILVAVLPQVMGAWSTTAEKLTEYENYYDQRAYNFSKTLKLFSMQAITSYGALTLSAFVYVPFGQYLLDQLITHGLYSQALAQSSPKDPLTGLPKIDFNINPKRLHTQLFAVSVTAQIVNAFTELALPFILRTITNLTKSHGKKANPSAAHDSSEGAQAEDERAFLKKVNHELSLPAYDTFGDYAEMATQYGFVVLWSVIWPLNPVFAFVNNFFELRTDLLKICFNARRPVPIRTDSVGPWLEVLGFLSWLAAMSNAALIFLYRQSDDAFRPGHSAYEAKWRTHIHGDVHAAAHYADLHARSQPPGDDVDPLIAAAHGLNGVNSNITNAKLASLNATNTLLEPYSQSPLSLTRLLPSWLPQNGPTGALISALLIALASEHAYALFRGLVRHVLERLLWRGSEEEMILIKRSWQGRREAVLRANMGSAGPGRSGAPAGVDITASDKAMAKVAASEPEVSAFWNSDRNVGLAAVQAAGKTE
ncbi:hypothetical protein OC845_001302 [Tilletia horrida]|nr:hypothetical protein OC845_001302 [Tilletia horrida]